MGQGKKGSTANPRGKSVQWEFSIGASVENLYT